MQATSQPVPHYPRVIAHRGGGSLAPENTLAAMRLGVAMGFKGVEFDVKLAADGIPFLLHDDTLDRTTNGMGRAGDLAAAELARLDAGGWFGTEYAGEPVPRFDEVANYLITNGIWANVEIKPSQGCDEATGAAVALAARALWRNARLRPVLSSFSMVALRAARLAAPELPRGCLVDSVPQDWAATVRELECIALHCNANELTPDIAAAVKSQGLALLVWTVNDIERARQLLAWGVDALVTDRLDMITPDFG